MNILFWDIDGTLLHTNNAGLHAFQQATKELLGTQPDFNSIKSAGMTDYYIASQVLHSASGQKPAHHAIMQLIHRYEELLPVYLETHHGYLLPSVFDLLTILQDHPAFVSLLLTGNTVIGAKTKLSHFKIDHFFDFTLGAFCANHHTRCDIAAYAKRLVQANYPGLSFDQVFVIGDTPHDIDCGKFIGAQTISVATGAYPFPDLFARTPWWALQTLPSPEEFIEKIVAGN